MSDSRGVEWTVYRRFSDFAPFDTHVQKMLPHLEAKLPRKELLRPLAGFLGLKPLSPTVEFLDERRRALDGYVKAMLAAAGGNRTAFWNHPVVLTFFDIPTVVQSRSSPASDRNCPVPLRDWGREMEKTRVLIEEAMVTLERAESTAARGHDTANHRKHLKRQVMAVKRSLNKLQASLDYFARIEKLPDDRLEEMSRSFQQLAGAVEKLEVSRGVNLTDGDSTAAVSFPGKQSDIQNSPIARTPARSHHLSSSLGSKLSVGGGTRKLPSTPPKPSVASVERQEAIIKQQDAQLSELSSIIQRHKDLGKAITRELDEQNQMLDNLTSNVDGARTKLNTANRRVKKL